MRRILLVLTALILVVSCNSKPEPPEHLISEDTYIDVLIELQLLKAYQANSRADSAEIDSLMGAIFKKYEVSKQQFKSSHDYYQNQLNDQEKRIDKAIDRLRKDRIIEPDTAATDSTSAKSKAQTTNNK